MYRITPFIATGNAQKLALLILSRQKTPLSNAIHTTASIRKWGDVYIPPDLKKWEEPFPKDFKEHPDRDLVNFPHPVTAPYPSKVRYGIFPDSWFTIFYPKTGVTGSYLFYGGLTVYLIQKEWWVIDEEIRLFPIFGIIFFLVYKLYGAQIAKAQNEWQNKSLLSAEKYVDENRESIRNAIATQKHYISQYTALPPLIAEAKRENLQLQLEAEYRRRLLKAHGEVKRRLDYMADLEESKRRFQRRYMIDWIVDQVKKTLTPQQDKLLLAQCVSDLKGLAQRATI